MFVQSLILGPRTAPSFKAQGVKATSGLTKSCTALALALTLHLEDCPNPMDLPNPSPSDKTVRRSTASGNWRNQNALAYADNPKVPMFDRLILPKLDILLNRRNILAELNSGYRLDGRFRDLIIKTWSKILSSLHHWTTGEAPCGNAAALPD